jgi:hypothetical protein
MDATAVSHALKVLAEAIAAGTIAEPELRDLADSYEAVEAAFDAMDAATKVRFIALQPLIAEKVGLPSVATRTVIMKNWGRQHVGKADEGQNTGDIAVIMKNWGRQHIGKSDAELDTPKDMSVILKNWGRQHIG